MSESVHVRVEINLQVIRENVARIVRQTGVDVLAVVKADAYGHGIAEVTGALADRVAGFCVFSLDEAIQARIFSRTGKESIALGPAEPTRATEYAEHHVRPGVMNADQARALRSAGPVLCVETGMQRFTCRPEDIDNTLRAGEIAEAFTHAPRMEQVQQFVERMHGRGVKLHAVGSSLLHEPRAWLDAVRPGLAIYRGAARVTTRLVEARDSTGPAGYSGFAVPRHGVILAGYSNGLRPGPCLVNGRRSRIIEVGMQSAYVELDSHDRVGDEVTLLGGDLGKQEIAATWGTPPQEALLRLCRVGVRNWSR